VLRILCFALLTLSIAQSSLQSGKDTTSAQVKTKPVYDDQDAYDVYVAVLPKEWMLYGKPAKQLIVQEEIYPVKMCLEPEAESAKLIGAAIADYNQQNEMVRSLQRNFKTDKPYVLLPAEAFTPKGQSKWGPILAKYPNSGGYFLLSAVGFNREKTVAIVWQEHRCGGLCGFGEFHVMQKVQNEWQPLEWQGLSCSIAY
jgi:hypothetical protein